MSEEGPRLKKKNFSSLSRSKNKIRIGSSPIPINNLTSRTSKSYKEELDDIFDIRKYSPGEAVRKSELLRRQLESEVNTTPTKKGNYYSFDRSPTTKTEYIEDVAGSVIDKSNIQRISPKLELDLTSIDRNGKSYKSETEGILKLGIPITGNYLIFKKDNLLLNKLVIHKNSQIQAVKFGFQTILIELTNNLGYVHVTCSEDNSNLWAYFKQKGSWNLEENRVSDEDLLMQRDNIITRRYKYHHGEKIEPVAEKGKSLKDPISPQMMYTQRATRSKVNLRSPKEHTVDLSDDDRLRERPPNFSPPLKHIFSHNKAFVINQSDFKTLYNNDWINDSIIDFFIKFEVEKAIKQGLFQENEIHAFNSFFFTKLMDKSETMESVDYYANIKRWLNKVDLMSFPYIIIPINEHAHWYCCIIKGLPSLLQSARIEKEAESRLQVEDSQLSNGSRQDDEIDEADDSGTFNFSSTNIEAVQDKVGESTPSTPKDKNIKKSIKAEIFIFDSLGQKHSNIHYPLKSVILNYCKEKFDIDISKDRIRVQNAKVPKQNNFNDCGIHVIYNVKKWLNNTAECEKLWKSFQRYAARSFFLAEERNRMRKDLIKTLIELHNLQAEKLRNQPIEPADDSDDEIEVLEYDPKDRSKSASPSMFSKNEVDFQISSPPKVDNDDIHRKTLDPKAKNGHMPIEVYKFDLRDDSLKNRFADAIIHPKVTKFLNDMIKLRGNKFNEHESNLACAMIEQLEEVTDEDTIVCQIILFQKKFNNLSKDLETSRPRNQSFRIDHDIGVTKVADINESDTMNEELTNLHLSDTSDMLLKSQSFGIPLDLSSLEYTSQSASPSPSVDNNSFDNTSTVIYSKKNSDEGSSKHTFSKGKYSHKRRRVN